MAVMSPGAGASPTRVVGRYAIYGRFARGGMAAVHFGRLLGPVGFSRTVAIKQLHPHLGEDPEFVSMLVDEARLAARVRHPNVVQTLDVISAQGELLIVLDYVHGESLSRLERAAGDAGESVAPEIVCAILSGVLQGLHAAHEARDPSGQPLEIVHRDVSPQNVLVGADGVARVIDFGVAKARGRVQTTREGQIKGKLAYMAPEQIRGRVSRRSDVFSAAVVLWEGLTGRRLFDADDDGGILGKLLGEPIEPPTTFVPHLPRELSDVVMRGLARDPDERFASAREMAMALEGSIALATPIEVGAWVERLGGAAIAERAASIAAIEAEIREPTPKQAQRGPRVGPAPSGGETASSSSGTVPVAGLGPPETRAEPLTTSRVEARRALRWAPAVLGSVLVIGAATFAARAALRAPSTPAAKEVAGPLPVPPLKPPDTPAASASAAPSASASIATLQAAPVVAPSSGARSRRMPAVPATRSAAPTSAVTANCSPPYVTDPMGLRHYKPECLK
jgi:hypothetical protein